MNNPKIEPCPWCDEPLCERDGWVWCETDGCYYQSPSEIHKVQSELVRLGKAAKGKHLVSKKLMKVIEMNNEMARRARALCENPPFVDVDEEIDESNSGDWHHLGYTRGENGGIQTCLDCLQEKGGK